MGEGQMEIREFTMDDYESVYSLWERCKLHLGKSDSPQEIERFIKQNPTTSLVGVIDGEIAGCILGGFDGRRGLIHHLAVDEKYRNLGYGGKLLKEVEDIFKNMGVVKISFWVTSDNLGVVDFYGKCGYELRKDIVTLSKVLR
jgi:putative acetyltransferase